MKRFYKTVATQVQADGWSVTLDGRPVRTPAGGALALPTETLAAAVAAEWQAQEAEIRPRTMPITQLAATALDRVSVSREACLDEIARFAGTDLLCYRAETPVALVARQQALWQPLVDWALGRYGADLTVVAGLMPVEQPAEAVARLRGAAARLDDLGLTVLLSLTAAAGSVVIALALVEGRITAEEAYAVSQLDETFQIEQWGEDDEARARRAALREDFLSNGRMLDLLR